MVTTNSWWKANFNRSTLKTFYVDTSRSMSLATHVGLLIRSWTRKPGCFSSNAWNAIPNVQSKRSRLDSRPLPVAEKLPETNSNLFFANKINFLILKFWCRSQSLMKWKIGMYVYTLYRRYYRTALFCLCRLSFAAFYVPVLEATNRWRCHRLVIKGSKLSRQIEKGLELIYKKCIIPTFLNHTIYNKCHNLV